MKRVDHHNSYVLLIVMAVLHFFAMYFLMYSMVNIFSNVFLNINQFYMAGLMTMPMIIIELTLMRKMYSNNRLNIALLVISIILLITFFVFIRQQTAVSNNQFLKSMIPHHASAILMCEKSSITDSGILNLCKNITFGQQYEIEWMKSKLAELKQ